MQEGDDSTAIKRYISYTEYCAMVLIVVWCTS